MHRLELRQFAEWFEIGILGHVVGIVPTGGDRGLLDVSESISANDVGDVRIKSSSLDVGNVYWNCVYEYQLEHCASGLSLSCI